MTLFICSGNKAYVVIEFEHSRYESLLEKNATPTSFARKIGREL